MTWTAPPVVRTEQLGRLGTVTERQMLECRLTGHRETLLAKCAAHGGGGGATGDG
ncbi:hypothetical protein ACF07V_07720 [Streptomyces sp. NPDC015661]|uniref:hypothetical protein n=1 Tax=Streptomyces sp. NPDC015661 TaxID=3364961 RepID=UPI0036F90D07